ncbi:hypothetical protein BKA66DRAFT_436361 [Pyrenochaeta sp. MPI-SDFR-AT-0127]|nr:hypothetical protein BKA66DRAFT_436361 [Pyrenochaeta sp. MPI-SDFR-AT-0127]
MVNANAINTPSEPGEKNIVTIHVALAPVRGVGRANETIEQKTPAEYKKEKDFRDLRGFILELDEWDIPSANNLCKHLLPIDSKECRSGNCYLLFYKEENDMTKGTKGKCSMDAPDEWLSVRSVFGPTETNNISSKTLIYFLGDGDSFNPPGFRDDRNGGRVSQE